MITSSSILVLGENIMTRTGTISIQHGYNCESADNSEMIDT